MKFTLSSRVGQKSVLKTSQQYMSGQKPASCLSLLATLSLQVRIGTLFLVKLVEVKINQLRAGCIWQNLFYFSWEEFSVKSLVLSKAD